MKTLIIFFFITFSVFGVYAEKERFSGTVMVGTGIAVSTPKKNPFGFYLTGFYNVYHRFYVGVGTGVLIYEKVLLPFYGDIKFYITRPCLFTPYVGCMSGYSVATDVRAKGGLFLSPYAGVRILVAKKLSVILTLGYELQKYERLKQYAGDYFVSEYKERLNHGSVFFKIGVQF